VVKLWAAGQNIGEYPGCGGAPEGAASEPPVEVPVTITQCPYRGELRWERTDPVTVTDMPEQAQPEVKSYAVEV
jgi:hypothetical protein